MAKAKQKFSKEARIMQYRKITRALDASGKLTANDEIEFKEQLLRSYGAKTAEMFDIELHNLMNSGMKGICYWKVCAAKYLSKDFIESMKDGVQLSPINTKGMNKDDGLEERIVDAKEDFSEYDKYDKEEIKLDSTEETTAIGAASDIEWIFNNIDNIALKETDAKNKGLYSYLLRLREDNDLLKDFYRNMWGKVVRDKMDKENKLSGDDGQDLSSRIKSLISILQKEVYETQKEFEDNKSEYPVNNAELEREVNKYANN